MQHIPKVSEDIREAINTPITPSEVEQTIKKLQKNKSPGPDGIVAEFYLTFRKELSPILAGVFEGIRKEKFLPPSMRGSHLVLIQKKNNNRIYPRC